jgi:RNA polymerase sigma factor (sigma-70 family)
MAESGLRSEVPAPDPSGARSTGASSERPGQSNRAPPIDKVRPVVYEPTSEYTRIWEAARQWAIRMGRDHDDAEDIGAKVAQSVGDKLALLPGGTVVRWGKVRRFIQRATKGQVINHQKADERRKIRQHEFLARSPGKTEKWIPDGVYEIKELGDALRAAVNKLPRRQKEFFMCYHDYHMTRDEIAEEYGVARKTVDSTLQRANDFLRIELAGFWPLRERATGDQDPREGDDHEAE